MKVSAQIHYAIVIMIDISLQGEGITVSSNDIARRQNISFAFVSQILNRLKRVGLLESVRGGVNGGYRLKDSPSELTIKRVVEGMNAEFCISPSVRLKTGQPIDDIVLALWKDVTETIMSCMEATTIEGLAGRVTTGGYPYDCQSKEDVTIERATTGGCRDVSHNTE